jgi:hypothetical protein
MPGEEVSEGAAQLKSANARNKPLQRRKLLRAIAMSSGEVSTPVTEIPCSEKYFSIGWPAQQPRSRTDEDGGGSAIIWLSQTLPVVHHRTPPPMCEHADGKAQ